MKIKYESISYRKDAAMWKKTESTIGEVDENTFYGFIKAFGYKSTDHGTWWKQEAYDEAHEFIILDVIF